MAGDKVDPLTDHLVRDRDGLLRFAGIVAERELDFLAENAAGVVSLSWPPPQEASGTKAASAKSNPAKRLIESSMGEPTGADFTLVFVGLCVTLARPGGAAR